MPETLGSNAGQGGAAGPKTLLPVGPQHGSPPALLSGLQSTYHRSNLEEYPASVSLLLLSAPPTSVQSQLSSGRAQQRCLPASAVTLLDREWMLAGPLFD